MTTWMILPTERTDDPDKDELVNVIYEELSDRDYTPVDMVTMILESLSDDHLKDMLHRLDNDLPLSDELATADEVDA